MRDVCKERVGCTYFPAYFQSLVQAEVRDMLLPSDTADYEDIHALELFNGLFRYAVCVGKVAQSAETESVRVPGVCNVWRGRGGSPLR